MVHLDRRRFLQGSLALAGLGLLSGCGSTAPWAPEPKRVPRIGYLSAGSAERPPAGVGAFREGLHDLGWIEGDNIALEYRWVGDGVDGFQQPAAELVSLQVDVILAVGTGAALASRDATSTIPIVTPLAGDPVGSGLVASLARPGGNVTGLSQFTRRLASKRLELLSEAVPGLSRVAVFSDPTNPASVQQWAEMQAAAGALRLVLQLLEIRRREDLGPAFEAAAHGQAESLTTFEGTLLNRSTEIDEFAVARRLPSIHSRREHLEAGGLMLYGPNTADLARRAATYVDKILKGAKPADLPVEQPTEFEFVINLKAAQALGLTIPQSVLLQATEVLQ